MSVLDRCLSVWNRGRSQLNYHEKDSALVETVFVCCVQIRTPTAVTTG